MINRQIRLAAVPGGLPRPEHFEIVDAPMRVPAEGEVLVRNRYFRVFTALRTLISGDVRDAPLPPLRPGDPVFGHAVGEVVTASGDLRPGELVFHMLGWRDHAAVPLAQARPLNAAVPDPVAHLSEAWNAYSALSGVVPGDTVFVTGGAGAVGSMAGPIARLLGAGRVIGSTGSPAKAERMISELGYDAVVLRDGGPIAGRLAEAAPEGIDVLVDNVGGEQLRAAVGAARPGARFVIVGALASQLAEHGGGHGTIEVDLLPFVAKGIEMRGFTNPPHGMGRAVHRLAAFRRPHRSACPGAGHGERAPGVP